MTVFAGTDAKRRLFAAALILLAAGAFAADKATLQKTSFAPAEPAVTKLVVRERGYYSLQAKSKTGTGIALVDRMAGVLAQDGTPGGRDGRIDLLLDPGEYKVVLSPDPAHSAPAELALLPFREANAGAAVTDLPALLDGEFLKTFLGDLETRSYWIYLSERAELRVEAAGRALSACALWQNGQWLLPVAASSTVLEPVKGRPMLSVEIHQRLEPGHYLLVCAGGAPRAWAEDAKDNPFYLRRGVRYLGANGALKLPVSPFGRDAYLINGAADYVECVRDRQEPTRLSVGTYNEGQSRYVPYSTAAITKESKEPWCRVAGRGYGDRQWIVLEAKPGDVLEVSFFDSTSSYSFPYKKTAAPYWVSTISSYAGRNLFDATPLAYYQSNRRVHLLKDEAVRVSASSPFIRKVNLMGYNSLFVFIEEAGAHRIAESASAGAKGKYRFVLLEEQFVGGAKAPEYQTPDKPFSLVKGYYVLEIQPLSMGILHLALYKDGSQRPDELLKRAPPAVVHAVTWPKVEIPAATNVSFIFNNRHNLPMGIVVRSLPLSLAEPLSAWLKPGETVSIAAKTEKSALIRLEGAKCSLSVAGKRLADGSELDPGTYLFNLTNEHTETDLVTLSAEERLPRSRVPKPVLKPFEETYPLFTEGRPYFADFERSQTVNVLLRVSEPALYRIETQGRLAMSLSVRTPIVPSLAQARENSSGRNALLESYLRPGDYLVSVSARGASRGRAGVSLTKTALSDEGRLPPEILSRKTVGPGVGLRYRIDPERKAKYSIQTIGLGMQFVFRLEDGDGFPLVKPGSEGAVLVLDPGDYYYYSLPVPFVTRRITSFSPVPETAAAPQEGKRFELALNTSREHVWKETVDRAPDEFLFSLPAALFVTVSLSAGMEGELSGPLAGGPVRFLGGRGQELELPAGAYRFAVKASETQNLLPYSVGVSTGMLASGLGYWFDAETTEFAVSVATEGVYDLWSLGGNDYRAALYDESGAALLAENDDMESDWNFRITQRLGPGRYRLRIEPAGFVDDASYVSMKLNQEETAQVRKLPFTLERTLGREIVILPVSLEAEGLLVVKTERGRAVKLGLYRYDALIAEGEDFLAVPLPKGTAYSLHVFQRDDRPQTVTVSVAGIVPREIDLPTRQAAVDCPPFLAVKNPAGVSYRIQDAQNDLLFSSGLESPCLPLGSTPVNTSGAKGFLVARSGAERKGLRLEPLSLLPDRKEAVLLAHVPHSFFLESGANEITLLVAETQTEAAGLAVFPRSAFRRDEFGFRGMDAFRNQTWLLLPAGGSWQGKAWSMDPGATVRRPERADLLLRKFPAAGDRLKKNEARTFRIEAGRGLRLDLDSGPQTIRLFLAQGSAAAVWKDNQPQGMAAAESGNRDVLLSANGGTLLLVNSGSRPALARAEAREAKDSSAGALGENGLETVLSGEGRQVFKIPAGKEKLSLCLAGENYEARLLARDGKLHKPAARENSGGLAVLSAREGDLEISYTNGFLKAFYAEPGREAETYAARSRNAPSRAMTAEEKLQGREEVFTFSLGADGFIAVSADAPGLVALSGNGKIIAISAGFDGGTRRIVRRLPKGSYEIWSRAFKDLPQSGSLELARITPVDLAGPDPEKKYFIGKGEAQVFQFKVSAAGLVGIGLQAESDRLKAELYDADGRLQGEGALIYRTLEMGSYYLVVYGADQPVQYAPLLYGHEGSVTGVPKDVIDQYKIQKEGEE